MNMKEYLYDKAYSLYVSAEFFIKDIICQVKGHIKENGYPYEETVLYGVPMILDKSHCKRCLNPI